MNKSDFYTALMGAQDLKAILSKAYLLLSNYQVWCQGAHALNSKCQIVRINSPEAVAWSLEGAVGKVSNDYGIVPYHALKFLDALVLEITGRNETADEFNDIATHESLLEFLQEAIKRADRN